MAMPRDGTYVCIGREQNLLIDYQCLRKVVNPLPRQTRVEGCWDVIISMFYIPMSDQRKAPPCILYSRTKFGAYSHPNMLTYSPHQRNNIRNSLETNRTPLSNEGEKTGDHPGPNVS